MHRVLQKFHRLLYKQGWGLIPQVWAIRDQPPSLLFGQQSMYLSTGLTIQILVLMINVGPHWFPIFPYIMPTVEVPHIFGSESRNTLLNI